MESTVTHPPASEFIHVTGNSSFHKKLEALDAQIVEAEKPVAWLKSKRLALTSDRNAANDRFIGRLPFEITSYIFEICFEVQEGAPDPGSVFQLHPYAPFRLGAVCREWRAIAWSLPALWTTLTICLYPNGNSRTLELAKQWLERTRSLPLSIRFYESSYLGHIDAPEMDYIDDMMRMVNSVCSRWQNLDLELSSDLLDRFGLNECPLQPSILRQISLASTGESYSIGGLLFQNRDHSPTRLRLCNVEVDVNFDASSWMNLTSFEADGIDFEGCLQVIRAATSLEELILHDAGFPATSTLFVTHLNLNSLTFVRTPAPAANAILSALKLPSLESIMIRGFHHGLDNGITESLISLIRRSSCHLKVLHPAPCFDTDHELQIQLLQQTPSLESFQFKYDCDRCWEDVLQMKFDNSTFLPHLQIFETEMPYPSNTYPWERILDSLETKQSSPSVASGRSHFNTLRSLIFRFRLLGYSIHLSRNFLGRFTELISQGLDISIEYQGEDIIAKSLAFHYPLKENL